MRNMSQNHRVTTNRARPLGRESFRKICDSMLRQVGTGGGPKFIRLRVWEVNSDHVERFYSAIHESHIQATILFYVCYWRLERHFTNRKVQNMVNKSKRYSLDVVHISSIVTLYSCIWRVFVSNKLLFLCSKYFS